jgi:tRNA threonylcarbamoyladenosine biosynthesis protein TsaE
VNRMVTIITHSPEETRFLGQYLGEALIPGMVIALDGDLGSGKTTFVQGIGKGLGISDDDYITSPTYNLINEYSGRHCLFHIDLYRLIDPLEIDDLGLEEIIYSQGISAIEWADRLPDKTLTSYLSVKIIVTSEETRKVTITACGLENTDLIEDIRDNFKEKKWH